MDLITFNKAKYDELRKAYDEAVKDNQSTFTCLGREWVTKYAMYVLESLEPKFKNMK